MDEPTSLTRRGFLGMLGLASAIPFLPSKPLAPEPPVKPQDSGIPLYDFSGDGEITFSFSDSE